MSIDNMIDEQLVKATGKIFVPGLDEIGKDGRKSITSIFGFQDRNEKSSRQS